MTDKMRAEFERTNARDHRRQPPKGNNYIDPMAQADWESFQKGYQAGRESMVVELPRPFMSGYTESGNCPATDLYSFDGVKSAIEAAGGKVKR